MLVCVFFMVLWLVDLVFIRVFYVLRVLPLLHLVQVEELINLLIKTKMLFLLDELGQIGKR